MSTAAEGGDEGFLTFYREYAHTGIHTITATALTAFGLLTFVHRGFVVLAIAVYVLPPVYLYLTRNGKTPEPVETDGTTGEAAGSERSAVSESVSERKSVDPDDGTATRDRGPSRPGETADAGDHGSTAADVADTSENDGETPGATGAGGSATAGTETGSANEGSPETAPDPSGEGAGDEPTPAGATDDEPADGDLQDEGSDEWTGIDSPTEETLLDAVVAGESAYAVGTNGVLLARDPVDGWELALESGPGAASETLRGVDPTADGGAVWIAGDGGVLGRYDPEADRHTDHSAPEGITDNWADLAVAGAAGGERLALVNGSGQVLLGSYDGSEIEWNDPVKPGSGSSMSAIEFVDDSLGYCCDTNAGVYRLQGEEFEQVGIEDASGFDALAVTDEIVAVANGSGVVQRFDGSVWTPVRVAEAALSGLAVGDKEWLAAGAGGAIYENREGDWERVDSPTEADIHGIAIGGVSVAVGEGGTVLERD
ncbi:hypothetical protein HAPAU_14390 [Halalkalicoccus paucihalophilus]|uniref:HVO-0234-like beta-propeller domain-containing protein n=1 Tax=Halalkalicoccus paucihalophilus TaxID=1008153 RepID=A0A151AFK9_9EURY|nr:hypothetical protein [Halalkalicoccus paucihalophilus]KYH26342.1 hypothetical protein HAPAU_14390 [Halalkalicoccus paucihalophilus]